jgi:hypothetical protein
MFGIQKRNTQMAKKIALLIYTVVGDDFATPFHLVGKGTEENRNLLREQVADVWCRQYWKELPARCGKLQALNEDLLEVFDCYFNNHESESVQFSSIEPGDFVDGELEQLIQARSGE